MSPKHEYKLKYRHDVLDPPITDRGECERLTEEGFGVCDALFAASLIWPETGGQSCYFFSVDGRNEGRPLSDREWFLIWEKFTCRLGLSQTLSEEKRQFAHRVFQEIRVLFYGVKEKAEED